MYSAPSVNFIPRAQAITKRPSYLKSMAYKVPWATPVSNRRRVKGLAEGMVEMGWFSLIK